MNEQHSEPQADRSIWVRGLKTVLMALTYQLASTVLLAVAIFQFAWALINETPNQPLIRLGRSLGRYQNQIARFVSFDTETVPFPFSEWPSDQPNYTNG
jgi:nucleoside recognition membrane protein YjiH